MTDHVDTQHDRKRIIMNQSNDTWGRPTTSRRAIIEADLHRGFHETNARVPAERVTTALRADVAAAEAIHDEELVALTSERLRAAETLIAKAESSLIELRAKEAVAREFAAQMLAEEAEVGGDPVERRDRDARSSHVWQQQHAAELKRLRDGFANSLTRVAEMEHDHVGVPREVARSSTARLCTGAMDPQRRGVEEQAVHYGEMSTPEVRAWWALCEARELAAAKPVLAQWRKNFDRDGGWTHTISSHRDTSTRPPPSLDDVRAIFTLRREAFERRPR